MNQDWTRIEVEAIVADYLNMLRNELSGIPYSKAEHRKNLAPLLRNRSEGSIEFKHQNISAVLVKLQRHYISGYKPRGNYQGLLETVVIEQLQQNQLDNLMHLYNQQQIDVQQLKVPFDKWKVPPPVPQLFQEPKEEYRSLVKKNYLAEEQRNMSIGLSGEQLVYNYERWRLENAGKTSLAKKIEWVSKEQGDGAGFDILSKNEDGSDRFIEVKTTTLGKETPIFFSRMENDFSEQHADQFHLYRVFELKKRPRMFQCAGAFTAICTDVQPMNFRGRF